VRERLPGNRRQTPSRLMAWTTPARSAGPAGRAVYPEGPGAAGSPAVVDHAPAGRAGVAWTGAGQPGRETGRGPAGPADGRLAGPRPGGNGDQTSKGFSPYLLGLCQPQNRSRGDAYIVQGRGRHALRSGMQRWSTWINGKARSRALQALREQLALRNRTGGGLVGVVGPAALLASRASRAMPGVPGAAGSAAAAVIAGLVCGQARRCSNLRARSLVNLYPRTPSLRGVPGLRAAQRCAGGAIFPSIGSSLSEGLFTAA